jgi:hypothetical protein
MSTNDPAATPSISDLYRYVGSSSSHGGLLFSSQSYKDALCSSEVEEERVREDADGGVDRDGLFLIGVEACRLLVELDA